MPSPVVHEQRQELMSEGKEPLISEGRSDLLNAMIVLAESSCLSSSSSAGSCLLDASITYSIRSESLIARWARLMPSVSMWQSDSRRPAVSVRRTTISLMITESSTVSRVVPATSVTIARSYPSNLLNRDDLPALGRPAIATRAPSCRRRPSFQVSIAS